MNVRRAMPFDMQRIMEIAERFDFVIPHEFTSSAVVTNDKDKVVAFGMIRPILEAIIITSGSKKDIIRETELLIGQGIIDTCNLSQTEIHAFVEDAAFAKLLKHRYGFKNPVGEALVLKL